MVNKLNTLKLTKAIENTAISKVQLAEKCGISRVTLDSVLKGKEIGLHKFLKIVNELGYKVGYFFDEEESTGISQTTYGDFSPAAGSGDISISMGADPELAAENADLRRRLIDAQEKIIKLMERQ